MDDGAVGPPLEASEVPPEEDALFEVALEAGADDVKLEGDTFEVTCAPEVFTQVSEALESSQVATTMAALSRITSNTVELDAESGRKVLKLHPVLLLGGITGSMTSGASLSVVTKAANSPIPSLGYTGAYAFANVILTIAGSVILFF